MPEGWKWEAQPSVQYIAAGTSNAAADGKRSLRIEGVLVKGATCNPPWPVAVSDEIAARNDQTYKLTAKLKAAKVGTQVQLMIQSYVADVYFWSRGTPAALETEWKEYEVVFKLPAKGDNDFHER